MGQVSRVAIVLDRARPVAARPVHGRGGHARSSSASSRGPRSMRQDLQGMAAARVRTNRFMLKWGWVQPSPGLLRLGPGGPVHRRASPRAESGPSRPSGETRIGCTARQLDSPARRAAGRAGVARLPQGAGGALRTGRQLLGHRLPPAVRGGRHPAADPVLADLERAQPEKYFAPYPSPRQVRPAARDLPRRDHEQGSAGPDRARRNARLRGR